MISKRNLEEIELALKKAKVAKMFIELAKTDVKNVEQNHLEILQKIELEINDYLTDCGYSHKGILKNRFDKIKVFLSTLQHSINKPVIFLYPGSISLSWQSDDFYDILSFEFDDLQEITYKILMSGKPPIYGKLTLEDISILSKLHEF